MASTYSPSLRIELIGDGDQSGIWGQTTNSNLGTIIEQAITGVTSIVMYDANYTLTNYNGVADEARNAVLMVTGTNSATRSIITPAVEKLYVVFNNTTGGYGITIKTASGTGVTINNGLTQLVYCDGTDFYVGNNNVSIPGDLTIPGNLTVDGTITSKGLIYNSQSVTSITAASPAVVTLPTTTSYLVDGTPIFFSLASGATLPTGLTAGTTYYVTNIAVGGTTTFNLALSPTGSAINTTGSPSSGTISLISPVWLSVLATQANKLTNAGSVTTNSRFYPAFMSANTTGGVYSNTATALNYNPGVNGGSLNVGQVTTSQTATITIATPAVVTLSSTVYDGTPVFFETTGALPTGITAGTTYYVVNSGLDGANKFRISATQGGSDVATSGTQSGTHTAYIGYGVSSVNGNSGAVTVPDMFSVTASVGSSNLTVTLPPSTISFRSSTLGTGSSTTITTQYDTTLTVPSGATLGSSDGIAATYAVLALNNSGTIRVGIINATNGLSFDETSLVSTTAIDTASDSATVIYSASALASVPFRIIGYITATESTAGTWATSPSLVQPAGSGIPQNGSITAPKLSGGQTGTAPIYGIRAWVNFDGTAAGTWPGGSSVVDRNAGSTTAVITTTSNHGLLTGHYVYAASGVVAGLYAVTVTGLKTFTITTAASTALGPVAITFNTRNILGSGNVAIVTYVTTGNYIINYSTALPNANYATMIGGNAPNFWIDTTTTPTTVITRMQAETAGGTNANYAYLSLSVVG